MDSLEQARWRAADAALDALLDLPVEQREAALKALPEDIRSATESLLRAHAASGLLDQAVVADGMLTLPVDPVPEAMPQVGPWTLGEELGRGGMAVVYRASRALAAGEQQAALKLLTTAALAGDGRRRFLREHQVLARLSHPNIATLLDAGVLADGTPYLAMQLVEGERIDHWCETHALGPREIVECFLPVCEAVVYAHRQLVVHRDIKPGNVLVDNEGRPRLLDFGIARFTDEALHGESTRTGLHALTPQYAAPEQFDGDDSGTTADVFGLGATLYRLLTGVPPRRAMTDATAPITQPSRSLDALPREQRARLSRALRGDLDAILMRALEPDPQRRYPDAAALAEDLRCWLAGLPVQAARGNRLYRLRKFARRHVWSLTAAALIASALMVGLAGTLWQAQLAKGEAERATAVRGFLLELFRESSPDRARGEDPPTSELLRRGAERARIELATRPELLAEVLQVIGGVQLERGWLEQAQVSLDDALALMGANSSPRLLIHAGIDRAMLDYELGKISLAAQRLEQTLGLARTRLAAHDPLRSTVEVRLADILVVLKRTEEAIALAGSARASIESRGGAEQDPDYAYALRVLGAARLAEGKPAAAVSLLRDALEAQIGLDPQGTLRAAIENELGLALLDNGEAEAAERAFANAVAIQRRLLGDAHPATLASLGNHAASRLQFGQFREAADEFAQLAALMRPTHSAEPHPDFAHALGMHALALYRLGELEQAESIAAEASAIVDLLPETDTMGVAWSRGVLAALQLERGDDALLQLMDETSIDCGMFGYSSFLGLRICVGQALAAWQRGQCGLLDEIPVDSGEPQDQLWLAAHAVLWERCADGQEIKASARKALDRYLSTLQSPPAWLLAFMR